MLSNNILNDIKTILEYIINVDPRQSSSTIQQQMRLAQQNIIRNKILLAKQDKARMLIQQKNRMFQQGIAAEQKREAMNPLLKRSQVVTLPTK